MDGDSFKVVHDEKMRCFNVMFDKEQTGPVTCDVDNGPSQVKRMSQEETLTPQSPNLSSSG